MALTSDMRHVFSDGFWNVTHLEMHIKTQL